MKHLKSTYLGLILILLSIALLSLTSCNKKKWTETTAVTLKSDISESQVILANNPFIFDTLILSINSLNFSGKRLQAEDVNIDKFLSLDVSFINTSTITELMFPQGTYEELNVQYQILPENNCSLFISGEYHLSSSAVNQVKIKLNIDQYLVQQVLDSDNQSTILLEKDNPRSLNVTLDSELLFSDINNGLWNAASVTSINGSNTVQVDELNNQSIYLALTSQLSNSISTKFE